jgi:nucleotide-binding universal stress UspA family protein
MFKRVIAAADGSSTSRRALRVAVDLAREQQAALCITYAVDLGSLYLSDAPIDLKALEASARKSGEQILKHALAMAQKQGLRPETRLLEVTQVGDRVADVIARFAKRWKADLIVISTHGRRGISHLFLGSVAESVLRIAPTPVLLVRGK